MILHGWKKALVLVLDTCAERASVALCRGDEVLHELGLPERSASMALTQAVRDLLKANGEAASDLAGVGVVSGPGSFTGVRVGLAFAKGFCEANGLPLAAVSRLAVLAEASELKQGWAILEAGRDQVYLREIEGSGSGGERLDSRRELEPLLPGCAIAVASAPMQVWAQSFAAAEVRMVELSAARAIAGVLKGLSAGGDDLALTDANYVRNEEAIYARAAGRAG